MNNKLTIAVCSYIAPEIKEVLTKGDYPDVMLKTYPACCNAHSVSKKNINKIIAECQANHSELIILSNNCIHLPDKPTTSFRPKLITLKQCFEPFLNNDLVFYYISKGYYVATNGWLRHYRQHIRNWGFDEATAKSFFNESMKKFMLLDTGISGKYLPNLKAITKYMGLEYDIRPIGLENCKMFLDSLIFNWRHESERQASNLHIASILKQTADYNVIFHQLETLINITEENKIIDVALELTTILFAPTNITYRKFLGETIELFNSKNHSVNITKTEENCFTLDIYYSNEILGQIQINGIQFPKFIHQYKDLGNTISQILGISIANARKYNLILNQKAQIEHFSNELQLSNKTKDKFFSIIAHDLKGPFSSMLGLSKLLLKAFEYNDYKKVEKFTLLIHQGLNNTYNLIINLLEWAKSQLDRIDFNPVSISLIGMIEQIMPSLRNLVDDKNITLEINIPETQFIYADENMLRTIFRNLISNAIKFTHENGKILISSEIKDNFIEMSVSDNGIGMNAETIASIFTLDSNQSTRGTSGEKGSGLGLILCKEFVNAHQGKIWAESEEQQGTSFYFALPL